MSAQDCTAAGFANWSTGPESTAFACHRSHLQMTVEAAKFKLSSHCGTPACDMVLQLKDGAGVLVATLMDSQRKLGFFSPQDGCASTTGHKALHEQLCMRSVQTARHFACMWCSHADCMTHHRFGVPAVMTRLLVERILANFIL